MKLILTIDIWQIFQACYTIGGQSISAAEIEFVILKLKAPVHRPQLVCHFNLCLHFLSLWCQKEFILLTISGFDAGSSQV